jgi:hypothetical protein
MGSRIPSNWSEHVSAVAAAPTTAKPQPVSTWWPEAQRVATLHRDLVLVDSGALVKQVSEIVLPPDAYDPALESRGFDTVRAAVDAVRAQPGHMADGIYALVGAGADAKDGALRLYKTAVIEHPADYPSSTLPAIERPSITGIRGYDLATPSMTRVDARATPDSDRTASTPARQVGLGVTRTDDRLIALLSDSLMVSFKHTAGEYGAPGNPSEVALRGQGDLFPLPTNLDRVDLEWVKP